MKVLVDTSIWSLALRRQPNSGNVAITQELTRLIQQSRVVIVGVIRQEILSGIREKTQFEQLRLKLQAFPDFPLMSADFERAAEFYNVCRAKGIQGSNTDFLLCAIAVNYNLPIFTLDQDFNHFEKYLPFKTHVIGY